MSTLLRDVLVIPEQTGAEDYVLRLTDSVDDRARRALDNYVVTPAIADAFNAALGLIAEATRSGTSRGAFLAGSFGSGKSHFMAVLHALLRHDRGARGIAALHETIARHDPALRDKKVLPLAFHLLGAESMEAAIFAGYLRQIRAAHPDATLPALHQSDALLADAEVQRGHLGDEKFFAVLSNATAGASAGAWAAVLGAGAWDADRYAAARAAAPGSEQRQQLVTALAGTLFSSYTAQADYVDIDTGLAEISRHAKSLGYDAVVMFLDELVLWLTFNVRDAAVFGREAQKLTKLVESSIPRQLPLISFVARQMDLRKWLADAGATGAEQEALDKAFSYQTGRFATIALGDDNLPYVARTRVLRRRDDEADRVLDNAFKGIDRRREVWDVLLDGINTDERHRGSDEAAFRLTYPFSPALMSTLRSLAGVMQRERTALKVMQQLLVERRDTLTVDDVIPVGDAFDVIVTGDSALDPTAAALFRAALELYETKLRPILLRTHGLTAADVDGADPGALPSGYRADDRLAKTLLLSAVAPNVPALKELTASRLASLNHGSIVSLLPGAEADTVLTKVREWARTIPEIQISSETRNPVIRMQLSDVDYESIVTRAKAEDTDGRRRDLIKNLVREAFGVADREPDMYGAQEHTLVWRGSRRSVDLVFGNVRDTSWLTEDHFRARPGTWRFVIDHPFDAEGHSVVDDFARVERLTESGLSSTTVVWLPKFLSEDRMRDVSRLVILDWLLGGTGERWASNADHLSEVDRERARGILSSQREALREGLRRAVQVCYGAASSQADIVVDDPAHERTLISLTRSFDPQAPVGADLAAAFTNLIDQAFRSTYPGHPQFDPTDTEVTVRELTAVYGHVERAATDPDGRVRLEGDARAVRRVAPALGIGAVTETHFLFTSDRFKPWFADFERAWGRAGWDLAEPVSAGTIRGWIRDVTPTQGLRPEVEDLVILAWGAIKQRAWYDHGGAIPAPKPGQVRDAMELRQEALPSPTDWQEAVRRAQSVFGIPASPHLTAQGAAELSSRLETTARERVDTATGLIPALEGAYRQLGLDAGAPGRLATARAGAELVDRLRRSTNRVDTIAALAGANLGTSPEALARSLLSAAGVTEALRRYDWTRIGPLLAARGGGDPRSSAADDVVSALARAVAADELTEQLAPALQRADDAVFRWLAEGHERPPAPAEQPTTRAATPDDVKLQLRQEQVRRATGATAAPVLDELETFLREHPDDTVVISWRIEP